MQKINPKIIVIIGVVFVSFSSIFIRMSQAPALVIATYRLAFTTLLLLPSVWMGKQQEIRNMNRKNLLWCMISGVFLALHFATWVTSIQYTSIASSTVLVNTHSVFVLLGSYVLLKEKIAPKAFASIIIALMGSIVISLGDFGLGSNVLYGDLLAILGAIFVSGYMMIGRWLRKSISATTYTFLVYLSCTVTLLILDGITATPMYPYPMQEWLIFLGLALFCTILGHSIFNWALEYIKPTYVSTSILGEPVFATVWALFLFREVPTGWQILGSGLLLFGIYLYIQSDEPIQKKCAEGL